ncbi:Uncharacterized protein SCF082_LOCUS51902 [Durusdinium trenchii]|uniref:Uncharacterized protein n=1 Tax=Durusdinium trenchii TaxID=1381693 RepID=A0ABP0SHQ1_9DINO
MTKLGKISGKDLSYCADNLGNILRYHPNKSIAFVVAPILISEKTSNNSRDEMRRIEDKYLAKGLATYMVTIRMEIPPTTKKVPLVFHGWLVLDASSESENIFKQCQLMQDRSLSEYQETAQYLSGLDFPEAILNSLLLKAQLPSKTGWKKGAHPMGKVRAYDTQPVDPPDEVKLSDFSCKLVTLELVDPTSKKFTEKYSVKVPANIRSRYSDDVVFRGDWFGIELHGSPDPDPLPSAPTAVELPAWVGEPTDIDGVLQRYNIEAKITGRLAGTTLFVVQAKDRSGKTEQVEERQDFKLFLAAHVPVEITDDEFILAHGASRFLKFEKVQDMKRKARTGAF